MIVCEPLPLRASDGVGLGWWRVMDAEQRAAEPRHLLLTHGTFSDRRVCMTLARAWARQGHLAWILEWRGHGSSDRVSGPYDMETVALCDIPAALRDLQARHPGAPLCAATHSGGGLALTMALLRQPAWCAHLQRMALFACQACDAGHTPWRRARLAGAAALTRLAGRIPARPLRLGVQDESHAMMAPWFRWNLSQAFLGADGFDYGLHQQRIAIPVMAVAGQADRFIAPPGACHRFWRRFGGHAEGEFAVCGPATGYGHAYGHASIMHSPQAAREVLPRVIDWLLKAPGGGDGEASGAE